MVISDRLSGPRAIARSTELKLVVVLRTLSRLRKLQYIAHNAPGAQFGGANSIYRPLRSADGTKIVCLCEVDFESKLAEYLRDHTIKRLPPGIAHGVIKSCEWDRDL